MHFESEGVGYAHLTLPADTFRDEVDALDQVAKDVDGRVAHRVCYLAGQSDVMLELRLRDFRSAFALHSLHSESEATGTNWLFGVPYADRERDSAPPLPSLRYIVHLRAVRDLLREFGVDAEKKIVTAIQGFLRDDAMHGEVLAGFGWSDFMVAGRFEYPMQLVNLVRKIQQLEIDGPRAFRRVLTLVGYDRDVDPTTIAETPVTPVMFARATPTRILEAAQLLARSIDTDGPRRSGHKNASGWNVISMDGKWDVLLQLNSSETLYLNDFIAQHRKLAESGVFAQHGLERLETHLLSFPNPHEDRPLDKILTVPCSCQTSARLPKQLKRLLNTLKPRYLEQAVRNVLGLFRAASKDANNCCEVAHTLLRCAMGLELLLRHRNSVGREMDDADAIAGTGDWEAPRYWFHQVAQANMDVEGWCTYAERIVSQRTVGRFEEFLSQNERVVSYRGGVQKLLYLTDSLLNSYARKVQLDAPRALPLVCLFDPLDIVVSHRYAGVVRVPAQFLFTLPLAINHLWHEVGVFIFNQQHSDPRQGVRYQRMSAVNDLNSQMRHYDDDTREREMASLALDLADTCADALTLVYGFRGDVDSFIISVASTLFETASFKRAPRSVKSEFLTYLLTRLYLATECWMRARLLRVRCSEAQGLGRESLDDWRPADPVVDKVLDGILTVLRAELFSYDRYRHLAIGDDVVRRVRENIADTLHVGFRGFLSDIVWSLRDLPRPISDPTHSVYRRITEGELCDLTADGVDIHDLFLLLQLDIIRQVRTRDDEHHQLGVFFQPIAALTRSSIVSFYNLERPDTGNPPSVAGLWSS